MKIKSLYFHNFVQDITSMIAECIIYQFSQFFPTNSSFQALLFPEPLGSPLQSLSSLSLKKWVCVIWECPSVSRGQDNRWQLPSLMAGNPGASASLTLPLSSQMCSDSLRKSCFLSRTQESTDLDPFPILRTLPWFFSVTEFIFRISFLILLSLARNGGACL